MCQGLDGVLGFFPQKSWVHLGFFLYGFKLLEHSCYPWAFLYSDSFVFLYLCHVSYCPYRFPTITYMWQKEYLSHDKIWSMWTTCCVLNKVAYPACPSLSFSPFPPFFGSKHSQTPFNVVYKISMQLNSREMFWTKINICMFLLQCGTVF